MSASWFSDLPQLALAGAALLLAVWCAVLARRLRRLNDLETGLGGAIAVMAAEVARLESALARAREEASASGAALGDAVERARAERLRWAAQGGFAPDEAPRRRIRRRREHAEAGHETA
ncbi:hypothetical protein GI374_04420 [Paracoccus sp. S-4012]|uniref:hypothetical protein n=1 Tax=Paracoccus sp. S-4012 TaxID=2665648 RepID=UPI0012B10B59|nr:hypothetical protein [Paracoccus sp. S-4012]MRX49704.1 hypothetical protein [Paracoccus sp. S-4012]